ncbi:hypothetical protein SOVF_209790 isoform B [Spinacia oleracea]|nr:hypothetical protein SOVF_209790 isoform B [Spinacia oleracea]
MEEVNGGVGRFDLDVIPEKYCKEGTPSSYKTCLSPPHGLISVGGRFLASSQLRESSTSGLIHYWSWNKK